MESSQAPHRNIRCLDNELAEEESLRHLIRTKFMNGMKEDFIAIILGDLLEGLKHLHVVMKCGYEKTSCRDVFLSTGEQGLAIGLAYVKTRPFVHPGDPWEKGKSKTDGIWGLGIIALELAYGSLSGEQLNATAESLLKLIQLKLAEPSNKSKTIILPEMTMLLNVERLVKQLEIEENYQGTKNIMAALKKLENEGMGNEFSRDFLHVVKEMLDDKHPTPAALIMANPFLQERDPTERENLESAITGKA